MKLGYQLGLIQTQKLIMTPELRQAINILQLSTLELSNFIEEQLLENPLLEIPDENVADSEETKDENDRFDIDWQDYFADGSDLGFPKEAKDSVSFENFVFKNPSLQDYLEEQLRFIKLSNEECLLARFIIGNLDHRGYFPFSIEETASHLGIQAEKLENILKLIQSFEPDGIGARNLEECLIIQLNKKKILTPLLKTLITNHLNDIAQGKYLKISKKLDITLKELQKNIDILKGLNPKPASGFGTNQDTRFIVPDIYIEKIDNEYIVLVNDVYSPRLIVNNLYKDIIKKDSVDNSTKNFVERKLHSAVWLIKSIEQRRITLYSIANVLVELQRNFLDHGISYLVPLILKDVADRLGIHESTVSRAINNKYVQTPRGLYPLKFFFSNGINNKRGEKISSKVIKNAIRDIIESEDPQKPYSDQKLSDLLRDKGIKIARRTISKYREELGIPSASIRKRY